MRHIHVELPHKKAPLDLRAQEGHLPPTTAPAQGLVPGTPRHFGQEEMRLQKVYQVSIFSPPRGFSTSTESLPDTQRTVRLGVKRGLEEPQWPAAKRPSLGDSSDEDALEGEVLCGPAPAQGVSISSESLSDTQRPVRSGVKRGLEESQRPATKRPCLGDSSEKRSLEGEVLCGSAPAQGTGLAMGAGGPTSVYSCTQMEQRDSEGGPLPRSPPLSPSHNPSRRSAQHNHDRQLPDAFAPLSSKSVTVCEPPGHYLMSSARTENHNGNHIYSAGSPVYESCSNGSPVGQPSPYTYEKPVYETPNPASPTSPPGPFSPPHHTEMQEPGEATEWEAGLESSPPERSATQAASSSSKGLSSWEKTPITNGHRLFSGGHCQAKKRLLSPPDTAEPCVEDEKPSTSKSSRLSLLAPGLGLDACRSTDSKAAPYWNHLLPSVREQPKTGTDTSPTGRLLKSRRSLKSRKLHGTRTDAVRSTRSSRPSCSVSRSLLVNLEESILKERFPPSGQIEGFTAEIGASGSYCPQHVTLPVKVSYFVISEHSAPLPFLGVIFLEPLGKKGYSIPKAGTIQVTLFNPNKSVVKMFVVTYNFNDMPVNHMTFLRQRIFLVPVEEGAEGKSEASAREQSAAPCRPKSLCYLMHLRFQSSKSGKIYLHSDIRLLFSRKSIEVDAGVHYDLKSFTEVPRNPKYSPRV
ncbi:atos homolog protein B [Takifugu flavidus]|uniref:Atos homolog protein B n=1 Tax=Takifugu flavidus TaxID=433684 RepID=A0A5C6MZI1_9TELE|nr:atos homolog protein B [Takifugu flavidus]XP_056889427.1 atos homolog protein B [Takifugu flavidus]XP_056889428.1 atos homolog protein B [Takifugu flavidus]TWW60285.1 Protein FAM214B [Takifugu flavidus]